MTNRLLVLWCGLLAGCGGDDGSPPTTPLEFDRLLLPYTDAAHGVAALDGGGVVALANGFGVVSSADDGFTWTTVYPLMAGHLATVGRRAFVGSPMGLYVFDIDAGTNAGVPTPFDPRPMTGMWSGGGRVWITVGSIWVGENNGASWRQITSYNTFNGVLPDGTALLSDPISNQWALTTNGGASFTTVVTPPAFAPAAMIGLVKLPSGDLLSYGGGVAASSDGGVTWTTRASILTISLANLTVDATGVLWGVTTLPSLRLVTSRDNGVTWDVASTVGGKSLAFANGVLYVAGTAPPSGLLCRDPGNPALRLCGPRAPVGRTASFPCTLDDAGNLWANVQGHMVERTPDDAWRYVHTVEQVPIELAYSRPLTSKPGKIITLPEHTEDGGASWITHDLALFPQTQRPVWNLTGFEALPRSGKLIASISVKDVSDLSIERGVVYTSTDDGRTWSMTSEQFLTAMFDIVADQGDIVFATEIVRGGDRINVRSEDAGVTWIEIPVNAKRPVAIDHANNLVAFEQPMGGATVVTYWRSEAEGWLQREISPAAGVLFATSPRFDSTDHLWFIGQTQANQESYLYRSKQPVTHN